MSIEHRSSMAQPSRLHRFQFEGSKCRECNSYVAIHELWYRQTCVVPVMSSNNVLSLWSHLQREGLVICIGRLARGQLPHRVLVREDSRGEPFYMGLLPHHVTVTGSFARFSMPGRHVGSPADRKVRMLQACFAATLNQHCCLAKQ